jgi:hypothetical protein
VRLAGARVQRLYGSQPVRVTAVCDRACDLRVRSRPGGAVTFSLPAGSRRRIALSRALASGRERRGRVRVRVLATAAGGGAVATESLSVRVRTRPALPVPAPLDVRARRRGRQIVVTWRTVTPVHRAGYLVEALRRTHGRPDHRRGFGGDHSGVEGRGRTRFAVHLHPRRPAAIRWVRVRSYSADGGATPRPVTVPVR